MSAETTPICLSVLCIYVMTAPPPPSLPGAVSPRPTRVGKTATTRIYLVGESVISNCDLKKQQVNLYFVIGCNVTLGRRSGNLEPLVNYFSFIATYIICLFLIWRN